MPSLRGSYCTSTGANAALLSSDKFADLRQKHREALLAGASPFKTYVAELVSGPLINPSEETKALARAGRDKVPGVIATNYESLCEGIFPSYESYVGERNLLFPGSSFA